MISLSSYAAELYVSSTGNDSNTGAKTAPLKTISRASALATPGTNIYVLPGTYPGGFKTSASGTEKLPIKYISTTQWGAKIVGTGASYNWLNLGNYVTVDGFEISGASTTAGLVSGPWSGGDVGHHFTAKNNFIHDIAANVCGSSGAIHVFSKTGQSRITNNVIRNIAVKLMRQCPTMQGIYIAEPGTFVANNLVSGVSAVGIQQWHGATAATIVNNTVFNSLIGYLIGSGDSGTLPNGSQDNLIANNIAYNNEKYNFVESGKTSRNEYINNLATGSSTNWSVKGTVIGTISSNPMFANYRADGLGNYQLASNSPAIDSGEDSFDFAMPVTDLAGRSRLQGRAYDLGAYEYVASTIPAPVPTPAPSPVPVISVSADTLSFEQVRVRSSSVVKTVTIKNNGKTAMNIPNGFVLTGDFTFGNLGTCAVQKSYAPGASCTASIVFKPKAKGSRSGTLSITTSASSKPIIVKLFGTGT